MTSITSRQSLTQEFIARANAAGLVVDVPPDGAFGAEVAIVAEAPGEREKVLKTPLVGGSGQFLWNTLRNPRYGITRSQLYVTNVIKRQVSLSTKGDDRIPVPAPELANWVGLLHWELSQLPNLKYVVLLGNFALEAILDRKGITNWRGSAVKTTIGFGDNRREVMTFCAQNPALILREPTWEIVFRHDMGRMVKLIKGDWQEHKIEHHINPSPTEAMAWLDKMQDERKPVSYDIETMAQETACIGFANSAHEGMCINFRDRTKNVYGRTEEVVIRRRIQHLLADNQVRLVAQNGNFDSYWLWYKDRISVHRNWFDTLLAHHTLYSTLPHSLGFLTSQYTTHPFYKDDGKSWREGGDIDEFWRYNVKDCCITLAIQQALKTELEDAKLDKFFFDHVMRLQKHLTRMTVLGIPVDSALKEHISVQLQEDVNKIREKFCTEAQEATGEEGYYPSPSSPKQLKDLFFRRLRLVGRGDSTDAANRQRMKDHPRTSEPARRMLTTLDKFAEESKFLGTYANSEIDIDGRMRCEYKQYGTTKAPGRLSSSQTLWGSGGNLQNQPDRAQGMYIAPPGYRFVYFDLSQAEARVCAWLWNIPTWKEQFERARLEGNFDCHRALAADMWGLPYDDVPKEDRINGKITLRFTAKRCRHGLNYRMGPSRLAETTGLSLRDAEDAYARYHRTTPEVERGWNETKREFIANRMLYNAYGRRLVATTKIDDAAMESIVAFIPQSTIGDKVSQCIYQCEDDEQWPASARIILNVHDALIAVCKIEDTYQTAQVMKRNAELPIIIRGEPLIIPCDLAVSHPTAWEAGESEEGEHTITYMPSEHGQHRWGSLRKIKNLEELAV
jgi:uracil-DNA glycosylase family 4